jgi:hypothetical protein
LALLRVWVEARDELFVSIEISIEDDGHTSHSFDPALYGVQGDKNAFQVLLFDLLVKLRAGENKIAVVIHEPFKEQFRDVRATVG